MPEVRPPGFVARDAELARLTAALARPPAAVLIEGEAGIGKSRMLREYLATSAGRRHRPLLAACPPFRQPCTLGPVVDAARQAADDIRGLRLSDLAGALRPLFPEWAAVLPPAPEPLEDTTAARHRLYRALSELLDRLRVQVLVVEDLHWADEATVEFLLFLLTRQELRVSVVMTWRAEEVPPESPLRRLSSRLPAGTSWERITLDLLDVAATAELVGSMLPGGEVSEEFAKFLHAHTDGLPLAIEESVRLLRDCGDLRRHGSTWVRRHLDVLAVPPTVRDTVLQRAARLTAQAQTVLQAVAVLSDPSPEPVLLAVSGLPGDAGGRGLPAALGCGLLEEDIRPNGRGLISFRHALAARAIYDAIPARQRRELHLRAGRVLEDQSPLPTAQLTRHFREAGQTKEWCQYAEQAADLAMTVGDHPAAAALLHDLVTNAGLPADVVVRLTRRIPLNALTGYSSLAALIGSLRSLVDDAALGPAERAEAGVQLGRLLVNADEYEAGAAALERAVPGLAHRPADAAWTMIMLGWPGWTPWPAAAHRRWLDRGWAIAQQAPIPDDDRLLLAVNRTIGLLDLGEEAGWEAAAELPADASSPRQALQVARGLVCTGDAAMRWGRYGDARRRAGAALEVADRHDFLRLHGNALRSLAHLDWLTGAWSGLAERAMALAGQEEEPLTRVDGLLVGGLLDMAAGLWQSGEEKLELVIRDTRQRGLAGGSVEACAALARARLAAGRSGDALALTDEPMRVITTKGIWLWATDLAPVRVQALAAVGKTAEATKLITAFARGLRGRNAPAPQASLASCRATLACLRGDHDRGAALFGRASQAWQALPRPYEALLAQENQATCLLASGRSDAALSLLTDTHKRLSELGATGDAGRVERMLREHGVRPSHSWRGGRHGYGDQLSPRELEVVRLVAAGRPPREIAAELCRSPSTVYEQLGSAMRKLGVTSRTALAMHAVRAGLASGHDPQAPLPD